MRNKGRLSIHVRILRRPERINYSFVIRHPDEELHLFLATKLKNDRSTEYYACSTDSEEYC